MSGSFESVRWNARVQRLDLRLYSHPTEFWGNGVKTHANSKGKKLSARSSRRIESTMLHHTGQQSQHTTNWAIPAPSQSVVLPLWIWFPSGHPVALCSPLCQSRMPTAVHSMDLLAELMVWEVIWSGKSEDFKSDPDVFWHKGQKKKFRKGNIQSLCHSPSLTSTHTDTHIWMQTCTYQPNVWACTCKHTIFTPVDESAHTRMHARMHTHTHTHSHSYTHLHTVTTSTAHLQYPY